MPKIHNPDWNTLKLSDFPEFRCLCELCECGCFERSKKKHSAECPNRRSFISQSFDSPFDKNFSFDSTSLYKDTFRKYNYEKIDPENRIDDAHANDPSVVLRRNQSLKIEIPRKYGPKEGSIELPSGKVSKNTTNKDHFKLWNSAPAKTIPEYPEFASSLMYPTNKRQHLTTNEEMFYKNYGKYAAQSSAFNIFENTFKIHKGKMDLRTVQKLDFPKQNVRQVLKDRGPIVTKEMVERRGQRILNKIPMDLATQNMVDFKFDPEKFREAAKKNETNDLFKSKLNDGMSPPEADYVPVSHAFESSYNLSYRDKTNESIEENKRAKSTEFPQNLYGESHLTHNRNIRFANTFDNRMIPSLRVLKTIVPPIRHGSPSKSTNSSINIVDEDENPLKTIYNVDFKERGWDVCMAKAYGKLLNDNALKQKQSMMSINKSIDLSG